MKKKPIFKLRTLKSFIICSPHWQTRQFQVSTTRFRASRPSIRSSSAELTLCHSSGVFEIPYKPSLPMNNLIKPVLVVWGSGCKSCMSPTARSKNWGNKRSTVIKNSMRFFTIKAYRLYPKPFERSWLAVSTTIFWPAIWHREDLQIVGPKILLTKLLPQRWSLRERLWCLFSLQISLSQALWWSSILARINALMEGSFNELLDRSTSINRLEGR